jgi:rhamnosyltransferase
MRIAILMSTYNGENYLEEQLKSLMNQTIKNAITVYIRDDGSLDNTVKIIEKWKKKIPTVLIKGKNIGPSQSFWKLLTSKNIDADYFAFCDQDDIWDKRKIEIAISKLDWNHHLYVCNYRVIGTYGELLETKHFNTYQKITIPRQFISGAASGCSMVFTKELRNYLCTKSINYIPMHDTILMLYALEYSGVFWDKYPRYSYRAHSNNVVNKTNKLFFDRFTTTYMNWTNSKKNSMDMVAKEMLHNCKMLDEMEKKFLLLVSNYKSGFKYKFKLAFCTKVSNIPRKSLNSYRIRLFLNMY